MPIYLISNQIKSNSRLFQTIPWTKQESLALASMARDDPSASSTASSTAPLSTAPASSTACNIYISRLYHDASPSVCLSVCDGCALAHYS